jgi:outer membrane lipoprotein-sorting protein
MAKKQFFLICIFLSIWSFSAFAQTVDEIVKKNVEARGGHEKIKALKTVKFTGKMSIPSQPGYEGPIEVYLKRPNLIRVEFTLQGKKNIEAYDGETPWMLVPIMGSKEPKKMFGEDANDIIEQSDFDGPLVDYKEKGNTVELIGKEEMKGTPVYKLKVTLKTREVRNFYLDAESYLDLKIIRTTRKEGMDLIIETYLGDYKEVSGLMVPFSTEARIADQVASRIDWENVEFDVPVEDSIFKLPAVETPVPSN